MSIKNLNIALVFITSVLTTLLGYEFIKTTSDKLLIFEYISSYKAFDIRLLLNTKAIILSFVMNIFLISRKSREKYLFLLLLLTQATLLIDSLYVLAMLSSILILIFGENKKSFTLFIPLALLVYLFYGLGLPISILCITALFTFCVFIKNDILTHIILINLYMVTGVSPFEHYIAAVFGIIFLVVCFLQKRDTDELVVSYVLLISGASPLLVMAPISIVLVKQLLIRVKNIDLIENILYVEIVTYCYMFYLYRESSIVYIILFSLLRRFKTGLTCKEDICSQS